MKKTLIILLLVGFNFIGFSQDGVKLKLADKNFESYAYPKAAGYYLSLAKQNVSLNHVSRRLAECYFYMGEVDKSAEWYEKVMQQDDLQAEDLFRYAKMLRRQKKYNEADKIMERYYKMKPNKKESDRYEQTINVVDKIKKEKKRCTLDNLSINTEYADFGAFCYADYVVFTASSKKRLFMKNMFVRNKSPYLDIFYVKKEDLSNPEKVKSYPRKINSRFHDGPATFGTDTNKMFFTRNNQYKFSFKKTKNGLKIYTAEKNKDGKWGDIQILPFSNNDYSIGHPTFSPDFKKLYFISDMPGGFGGTDIYYVNVNSDGTFGSPVNMGEAVNTDGNEMFPFVNNENIFFFSSDGHLGLGGLDIFYSQPDYKGDYVKVKNAGIPMNSSADDFSFYMNDNNTKGFISSNRDGGRGSDDIYSFDLLRPFKQQYIVKGEIKDKLNKLPLDKVVVILRDSKGAVLQQLTTDEKGTFEFEVEPDQDYKIECNKEEYAQNIKPCTTKNLGEETDVFVPVELKQNTLTIYGLIADKKTKEPLSDVSVKMINTKTGKTELAIETKADGSFSLPLENVKLNDLISYNIQLHKEGYIGKDLIYTKRIKEYGIIDIHNELDVSLTKLQKGLDLAKVIDIKPIYFDLGKFSIRPDAATELDKIVKVMKENPTMVIELGSHTDSRGSASGNLRLSDKRAKSSVDYIRKQGIAKNRIYGKGYGETKLLNRCKDGVKCSDEEHQQNRRTEFIIIKN